MARVLLIAPLSEEYSGIRNYGAPSLGVHRIASFLRAHGHEAAVWDCNIHSAETLDGLLADSWDTIGISILNDTLLLSLEMFLRLRREQPNVRLVAGGPEATLNYQEILDNTDVDIVVLGEGELPMLDICNGKPIGDIEGIITRRRTLPVTSELLWQYYQNIDFASMGWEEYWERNNISGNMAGRRDDLVRLVTSSHCLRGCNFCSVTRLHEFACGRRVMPAYLSGEQIRLLLARIIEQVPDVKRVYFDEDSILPTVRRLDDFCSGLRLFKDRLQFLVQTETDKVTQDTVRKLADVGVRHISFGVENCSSRVRRLMGKQQNEQRIEDIIGWCAEFGVRCYYLIILFAPESNIDDLRINHDTLTRWQQDDRVLVSIEPYMMPYRGARIYSEDFEFAYTTTKLSNGRVLKHPYLIYPRDPAVRLVMDRFQKRMPEYFAEWDKNQGESRRSKDHTGKVYVRLLGDLLSEQA
ncbi:MAG TPA: cobalamin-dependent protein [Dehalococcoidia bacterium]|nr:cobalamin-dependent protein [Dehalococcoidia bacterium]